VPLTGARVQNPRGVPPTPVPEPIPVTGCRHDGFGNALKAFGILRALNVCAAEGHADPNAEAWWDTDTGVYQLRSPRYPTEGALAVFFEKHYRPTPVFSPWNTGGGLDEKKEITFRLSRGPVALFLWRNRRKLKALGLRPGRHRWRLGRMQFDLTPGGDPLGLEVPAELIINARTSSGKKPKEKLEIRWNPSHEQKLTDFARQNADNWFAAGLSKAVRDTIARGGFVGEEATFALKDRAALAGVAVPSDIEQLIRVKKSGKKAVMARVESAFSDDLSLMSALRVARKHFHQFEQVEDSRKFRGAAASYRDQLGDSAAIALDAVLSVHTRTVSDNPAFLNRGCGEGDNSELFRSFWNCVLSFLAGPRSQIEAALFAKSGSVFSKEKAPGTPFFPDLIKTYNNGLNWILEVFPFCALDFVLAVEGALAFRGSAARSLGARNGNFAAFPFVFETSEDMSDEKNEVKGPALSIWLPLWNRPATFAELESFILDSQARLPGREPRFTAEFVRATRSQGVAAGFAGYQEFRFKMKGTRVPWVCTGRYLAAGAAQVLADSSELLRPLDEAGFLDQLRIEGKEGRVHRRLLAGILDAVEDAVCEGEPHRYLAILERIFEPVRLLAKSKRFQDLTSEYFRKPIEQLVFCPPLPQKPWLAALGQLEAEPEFEIARAVASILGCSRQSDGQWPAAEPLLGSLLPLKTTENSRYLPKPPSPQAVWSGLDLCGDLARVLARRYHDSRTDDAPALVSAYPARLASVLQFLRGELDDERIARYIEGLSLIGWMPFREANQPDWRRSDDGEPPRPIPLPYAAIRGLLQIELNRAVSGSEPRHRTSLRTLALLRERSSSGVAAATAEALHRLSIAGVPNPYGAAAREEKPTLAGRDIIWIEGGALAIAEPLAARLAAAVCVPLRWSDRFALFHAITLPQTKEPKENI